MSATAIVAWGIGTFVVLRALQYVLTARVFLTCAARHLSAQRVEPVDVGEEDRAILQSEDSELADAGYKLLFTAKTPALLTLYELPEAFRVLASESKPVRLELRRSQAPEAGRLVTMQLETPLADGRRLQTSNFVSAQSMPLPHTEVEAMPGADLAALERRHLERLASVQEDATVDLHDPEKTFVDIDRQLALVNKLLRDRGFTVPTRDPLLDRFTVKGAFGLAHMSMQTAARQKRVAAEAPVGEITEGQLELRAAADRRAVLGFAAHPDRAPRSNTPLWSVVAATVVLSFAGMSLLWNALTAVVVLAVITLHESGHALAMRRYGYRDVNVFFVPMLGALTVGRDTGASVRDRLKMLLAGPVPGLWLAVLLLAYQAYFGAVPFLRPWVFGLFVINALNLLPITPFDGGRALELLTRPDSKVRIGIQAASGLALLALGAQLGDVVLVIFGVLWLVVLRRQLALYRIRRLFRGTLVSRESRSDAVRRTCAVFAAKTYASWRAAARISTARLILQQASEAQLGPGDRAYGVLLYVFAWVPAFVILSSGWFQFPRTLSGRGNAVVLALVLIGASITAVFLALRWWARGWLLSHPGHPYAAKITPLGLVFYGCLIALLIYLFALTQGQPTSQLGILLHKSGGLAGGVAMVAFVVGLAELRLKRTRYALSTPPKGLPPPQVPLLQLPEYVPSGFKFGVEILNDTTTPMEFVVSVLGRHLGLKRADAIRAMLDIHARGGALFRTPTWEAAETAAGEIALEAAQRGHHLVCRAVSKQTSAA